MQKIASRKLAYSVVIPLKDESGNILQLDKEVRQAIKSMLKPGEAFEVIYVNDGSIDNTLDVLKTLSKVKILNLSQNYGQSVALDAGFKEAKGEIVISLDGDLQNDPKDIPRLVEKLKKENLDVVAGWRKKRKDKNSVKILTRIGRFLRKFLIHDPVHDSGCTLRAYKNEAVKSIDLWGDMHRYTLSLLAWKGYKISELEVSHRPRIHGKTKYTAKKAIKGFIDLLYIWFIKKYSSRPLHIFGFLGLISFLAGLIIELRMAYEKLFFSMDLSANAWFVLGFFLMIMGVQFFISGILLDLLIRTYFNTSKTEKRYNIREVIVK